jgi:hypothetical protein
MNTTEQVTHSTIYRSDVRPTVETSQESLGKVIAWADQHPHVWDIVTHTRSRAFGLGSCEYIGWAQRSMRPNGVLERARHLMELVDNPGRWGHTHSIFLWRAKFTFDHYQDKRFLGGFFQQHDGRFPRSCLSLDFTPETFEQVLDRFCQWIDPYYQTVCVTLDGRTVHRFNEEE